MPATIGLTRPVFPLSLVSVPIRDPLRLLLRLQQLLAPHLVAPHASPATFASPTGQRAPRCASLITHPGNTDHRLLARTRESFLEGADHCDTQGPFFFFSATVALATGHLRQCPPVTGPQAPRVTG